jgi:hypothetical protein
MQSRTLSPQAPMNDLNIREYAAIRILAGLVASNSPGNPEAWAEAAVWYADALMTELNFVGEERELPK